MIAYIPLFIHLINFFLDFLYNTEILMVYLYFLFYKLTYFVIAWIN